MGVNTTIDPREIAAAKVRAEFLERTGLKKFKNSYPNILAVLKQSGAPVEQCRAVARQLVRGNVECGAMMENPFDHGEILGKDGHPTHLMGYPYSVSGDDLNDLFALRSLGLHVYIHTRSNYGCGTVQIEVFAHW